MIFSASVGSWRMAVETSLKQWSDSTVFSIEPYAVADIKPWIVLKVGLSALPLEMVVVTYQGVTV
jgi:hypothetical protein